MGKFQTMLGRQFFGTSLFPSHQLTQLFILHRVYRTPEFLCAIGLRSDPACPRCGNLGSLIHLLWLCHKLQRYWAEVVGVPNGLLEVNFLVDSLVYLFGYIDHAMPKSPVRITVVHALFVACRQITHKWTSWHPQPFPTGY